VFDAAMLVGLHQYAKEELLAALLLFRLLYYITPFATALVFLGCRELWMSARVAAARKLADQHKARDGVTPPP
jgi:glycosyltransferase 2 family protein